jgi:hypothetical protein|nr:MAG TPA: zinc-ribbon domain protein [Caudoviricetes sp.]
MAEYISRKAAIAYIREQSEECQKAFEELGGESGIYADAYNDLAEDFYSIPAADVAPVVHGRWVSPHWNNSNYCCNCSECGGEAMHKEYRWNSKSIYPICPKCGARMDGEVDVD